MRRHRSWNTASFIACTSLCLAACGGGETSSGQGGTGGASTTGTGGQPAWECGDPEDLSPVSGDWCERIPGGPKGTRSTVVDLSAAHAGVRFFGPVEAYSIADQALSAALTNKDAWSGKDLSPYTKALPGVACARPPVEATLGPASVTAMGDVALVKPGTGPFELPAGTKAVLIDLRGLPWVDGLRAAVLAAVAPALATPVPGPSRHVREHDGMVDEVQSASNQYTNKVAVLPKEDIAATGSADLPLALLTGPELPADAVEIAAALRLAGRARIIGEGLRVEAAESRWQGVGDSGVAYRYEDLSTGSARWPDSIEPDLRTAHPECFAADILAQGPVPPAVTSDAVRPKVQKTDPFNKKQAPADSLGDARAALVVAHGAARLFFPYFATVGDTLDPRLEEVTAALPAAPSRKDTRDALRRLGAALEDGHNFVIDYKPGATGYFAVLIEDVGGEAVVRRSAAPGVSPGDTITSIDGVPAEEWYATELPRSAGATDGYRFEHATREYTTLHGPKVFGMKDVNGAAKTVTAEPQPLSDYLSVYVTSSRPAGFLSDLGAPDLYYLNMDGSVQGTLAGVTASIAEAASAKGLVVDMRGYPTINHYDTAMRLIQKTFSSPVFGVPVLKGPDERTLDADSHTLFPASNPSYTGPIALLVGHRSVSAAENFGIMLVDAHRVHVIGRQSAGTNGNITGVQLPGRFGFAFTGMEVLHADHSVFHGVGLVPDIEVPLSAADFAAGDDPELEEAITWLATQ